MMGAKPIVPGCQALLMGVPTGESGIVKVGSAVSPEFPTQEKNIWTISRLLSWHQRSKTGAITIYQLPMCPEKYLMRIDDDDPDKDMSEPERKDRVASC